MALTFASHISNKLAKQTVQERMMIGCVSTSIPQEGSKVHHVGRFQGLKRSLAQHNLPYPEHLPLTGFLIPTNLSTQTPHLF